MKTLMEQISEVKYEISQREHAIAAWKTTLKDLEKQRVHCQHEWDNGVPGYEHEGVHCKKCGINDQYAATLERMMK